MKIFYAAGLLVLTTSAFSLTSFASDKTTRKVASDSNDEISMGGETVSTCYALVRFLDEGCTDGKGAAVSEAMGKLRARSDTSENSYFPITVLKDSKRDRNQMLVSTVSSQSGQKAREVLEAIPKQLRSGGFSSPINKCLNISVRILGCSEPQLSNR